MATYLRVSGWEYSTLLNQQEFVMVAFLHDIASGYELQ